MHKTRLICAAFLRKKKERGDGENVYPMKFMYWAINCIILQSTKLWLGYQPMHKGRTWIEERKQRYRLFLDSVIYNNHWEISGNIHIYRAWDLYVLQIWKFIYVLFSTAIHSISPTVIMVRTYSTRVNPTYERKPL